MHHAESGTPPIGRRQRERTARRQEILRAAGHVFAERGYAEATLDEIAARAELAKGTIYNYFESKEEIFGHVVTGVLDDLSAIAEMAVDAGGSARETFYRYAEKTIEYYRTNEDVIGIIARELTRFQIEDSRHGMTEFHRRAGQVGAILTRALRKEFRGKHPSRPSLQDLAQVFVSIVHHRSVKRLFEDTHDQDLHPHEEALFVTTLFFEGVHHL
jgi:TetR/AcrR family transcriptional regulator, repressor of fatR-cypB operon